MDSKIHPAGNSLCLLSRSKTHVEPGGCYGFALPFGAVTSCQPRFASHPSLKKKDCRIFIMQPLEWRRGRDSNPRYTVRRTHAFQASSLNHSDTSPKVERVGKATHSP